MNLVKINSINLWDEEWENGYYSYPDGTPAPSNDTIRAKNYIPAQPNTDYYIDSDGYNGYYVVVFYDTNKSVIGAVVGGSGSAFTTINNCAFVRFSAGNYGTTYNHDIQICLNSESDKTTYHPHWVLGLDGQGKAFTADISSMLPSGIGCVDLGSLNWTWDSLYVRWGALAPSNMQLPANGGKPLQGLSEIFPIDIFNELYGTTTLGLCGHPNGYLYMYGLTSTTSPTGMLFYKKNS